MHKQSLEIMDLFVEKYLNPTDNLRILDVGPR